MREKKYMHTFLARCMDSSKKNQKKIIYYKSLIKDLLKTNSRKRHPNSPVLTK